MRRRVKSCPTLRHAVALALVCCLAAARAETRPHYGGALRVQLLTMFPSPEAVPLTAETLVRIDERGEIVPMLARGWQSSQNRWRFLIRTNVVSTAAVASKLGPLVKEWDPGAAVTSTPSSVVIQTGRPISDLLDRLARPEAGIPGSGPFRLVKWEAGRRAVLEANEDYTGGRPFLDTVEFTVAGPHAAPYQLSSADVWELPVGISRRLIPDGMRVWTSAALDLVALWLKPPAAALRDALSLSIDRTAIVNVLTQKRGEPAFGLLPQWLSGYEFVFETPLDPARAHEALKETKPAVSTLTYDPADPLLRSIAGRVAVNARDAGITLQVSPQTTAAAIELRHIRLDCMDATRALREISGRPNFGDLSSPEALYHAEKSVIDEDRIVPLAHVPQVFGIGPRVHVAGIGGLPSCDLLDTIPNFWLSP